MTEPELMHPEFAAEIHEKLTRMNTTTVPSLVEIDREIQSKAEHFDDTHGWFPKLGSQGPDYYEVEDMVLDTYGYDPAPAGDPITSTTD